ncbi:MAG: MarR family transcriptional regulator [Mariprofundaceae bacterium]
MRDKDTLNLEHAMGFFVNRTAFVMSEEMVRRFKAHGQRLSAQDFGILFRLWKQNGLSQVQIASLMMRDKTTITRRLDALVRKDLIERRIDPADRRLYRIHLTEQGMKVTESMMVVVDEFQKTLLADIPDEHKAITINTLKSITESVIRSRR